MGQNILAAQRSHRKIAVTTVAARGLAACNNSAAEIGGFLVLPGAKKKSLAASDFWGLASKSQEARSDHGRKSPQPWDLAAAATMRHQGQDQGGVGGVWGGHPTGRNGSVAPRKVATSLGTPNQDNIPEVTLRAKGELISEPRFSTPCEMRFFPREKGK